MITIWNLEEATKYHQHSEKLAEFFINYFYLKECKIHIIKYHNMKIFIFI